MLVGITFDLRQDYLDMGYSDIETAEFDRPETIAAIENTLQDIGYQTERIGNIQQLAGQLTAGKRWDIVFNIAEGMYGIGREAQVPALLDAYQIPYTFSDPLVLGLTLHKGLTKRVCRDLGIPTADFLEVRQLSDLERFALALPVFAKPIAEGTGKGITSASKITSIKQLNETCAELLQQFNQPVLVETYLPGREFTVAICGTDAHARVLGLMEVHFHLGADVEVYSYENKEHWEHRVSYSTPIDSIADRVKQTALDIWRGLGCRDAGRVDIRNDQNGIPNVIEVNPLAGIHPTHSDLPIICTQNGISYHELFHMIMDSALQRVGIAVNV